MADLISAQEPLPFVRPYLGSYLQSAYDLYNQPYQQYTGQRVAPLNQYQTAGYDLQAQRAMQGSPTMGAANTQLQSTINGNYLSPSSNPYLQSTVDNALQSTVRNYNMTTAPSFLTAMKNSGSFGNSGVMQAEQNAQRNLTDSLGQTAASMYGQNYANERGNQMQAMSMAPTFANQDYNDAQMLQQAGAGYQAQQQAQNDQNYQDWYNANYTYPQQRLGILGGALGIGNSAGAQQSAPGTSPAAGLLGGALTGAQIISLLTGSKP